MRITRERTKHHLGNIAGAVCVAIQPAERGGIHEGQITPHHLGKRVLVPICGVPAE
jgi:hypothetical protein